MITSFQQGRWTRFLLLLASLILFAVCDCEGLVPQDPSMIAYENGLPAPHVLQIQPNYCVPANIASHIMYYQTWCMWDQNQIFQRAGGIPASGTTRWRSNGTNGRVTGENQKAAPVQRKS